MAREIPGMYWDDEKMKYFAIQPNHAAPAGAHYSVDRVKKLKSEEEAISAHARNMKMRKDLIRRSQAFRDPLVGGSLSRQLGRGQLQDAVVQAFSQGLEGREILPSEETMLTGRGTPIQTPSTVYIGDFDYDPVIGSLFFPFGKGTLSWIVGARSRGYVPSIERFHFSRQNMRILWPRFGNISSININPYNRLMLTTCSMASQGTEIFLAELESRPQSRDEELIPIYPIRDGSAPWSMYQDISISCATFAHPDSGSSFVMGSTGSLLSIDNEGSKILELRTRNPPKAALQEVLAIECSRDNPFVVISGDRRGVLQFLDVRDPVRAAIIQHASSVCRIKHIKDSFIAVSGLKSTLCNYDQRFLKDRSLAESWPEVQKCYPSQHNVTGPIFTYPEHENDAWTEAGFDIDIDTGIAAAAQTGTSTAVKIFSLKTGRLLRTVDPTEVGATTDRLLARAVRFVPDQCDNGKRNLWVAKGSKIVGYGW